MAVLPVCVGNAAVSGSVPGMREKVLRSAKGKEKGTAAHGVQGCHAVCIGGAAGRIFRRKCMEGDGERTSGIAWGEGIYGGRGALDE